MKDNLDDLEQEMIFDELRELIEKIDEFREGPNYFAEGMKSMYLNLSNNN